MNAEVLSPYFDELYVDLHNVEPGATPLLAHYTSYSALEAILKNEQLWLSNPLYMNDHQELRFALNESYRGILESTKIKEAFKLQGDHQEFLRYMEIAYNKFAGEHALDVYVLCLSEHDDDKDSDGRLSMWRGYGSNASGACIVFDPRKIPVVDGTPFTFSRVQYLSYQEQIAWISNKIEQFCGILHRVPEDKYLGFYAAYYLFERLKMFALFTKHRGFYEEQEWRLVYSPEKDEDKLFTKFMGYHMGTRGPEPKLKLELNNLPIFPEHTLPLHNIVHKIILGPTNSHPLGRAIFRKILDSHKQGSLSDRVFGSTIPFRS
jgi:hypothetical protein